MEHTLLNRITTTLILLLFILPSHAAFAKKARDTYTTAKLGGEYPSYPKINYGEGDQANLIKQGEYLVKAGDCIACHTNSAKGEVFAGGLPIHTPFGTIYSPNITPDKTTGIGNWTDAQFVRAMKHGIAPNGSFYFPVFPYPNFTKLSDQDVLAIRAYLNAIPAIQQQNRDPDMPIPFRWRFMQVFWRLLFFDFQQGEYKPDLRKSVEWNRGAYLVQGLGHCSLCHTPLNFLGAPKKKYYLTGGFVDGFYAPNITSANLANTPHQDIINVFLKDQLIGGGQVQGPMLEVNHNSLSHLQRADLDAIAGYLKTVKSKMPPKPKQSSQISLATGKQVYDKFCVGCHGSGAGGAPKMGDKVAWSPRIKLGLNELYKNAIAGIGGMPPKGACATCSDTDVQSAVLYITSQSGGKVPAGSAMNVSAAPPSPTSLAKGKEVYTKVCATCHQQGQLGAQKLGDKVAWAPLIDKGMDVLISNSIHGIKDMPPRGACYDCSDADIIAAVKYMVQESKAEGDYSLW